MNINHANLMDHDETPQRRASHTPEKLRRFCCLLSLLLMVWLNTSSAQTTNYAYDANGRVVATGQNSGPTAQYRYNTLGHLAQTKILASGQLAIFAFVPMHGEVGTQVTIEGQGFSTSPSSDTVEFNGTPATVISASATQIVTTVPEGATTGPISVSVGGSSVVSGISFVVDDTGQAPMISAVSPSVVTAGGTVTVTGSHLDPIAGDTSVQIGGNAVQVSSASDTQLQLVTDNATSSGYVTVQTPYGEATSTSPVVVLPTNLSTSNVVSDNYATANGAGVTITIPAAGQTGALLFNGTAGQWLSVLASSLTMSSGSLNYVVYGPENVVVASGSISTSAPSIHLPQLRVTGTYLIAFQPTSASAQFNAQLTSDITMTPVQSLSMATTMPGQTVRLLFQANAGGYWGFAFNKLVESNGNFSYSIYQPDGTLYGSETCNVSQGGCDYPAFNLPATGTYTVIVTPNGATTMGYQVVEMPDPNQGAIQAGTPVSVNLAQFGQHNIYTFTATAGENVIVYESGLSTTPSGYNVNGWVIAPNGTVLTELSPPSTSSYVNLQNLPQTGTYMLIIEPAWAATASLTIGINISSTTALPVGGATTSASTSTSGENLYFTFNATAGSYMSIAFNHLVEASGSFNYSIYLPNGTYYVSETCYVNEGGCDYPLFNLPATGTYSVVVVPNGDSTMSFNNVVMVDPNQGTLSSGTPVNVSLAQFGQHDIYTFSAQAGQNLAFFENNISTTPSNYNVNGYIIAPNGTVLKEISPNSNGSTNLPNLTQTGTYMMVLEPAYAATGSLTAGISTSNTTSIPLGDTAQSFSTSTPGENLYFTFSGTAGGYMSLAFNKIVEASGSFSYSVYEPNGTYYNGGTCYTTYGGCDLPMLNMPTTGTYSVIVVPNGTSTMSFDSVVMNDSNEGTLAFNTPTNVSMPQFGQHDVYTFTAQAGQNLALYESNLSTSPSGYGISGYVIGPSGSVLATITPSSNATLNLPNLAQSGTYTVVLAPEYASTGSLTVSISAIASIPITLGAPAQSYSTTVPGQNLYFTFNGSASTYMAIAFNNIVEQGGSFSYSVYEPNGTYYGQETCNVYQGGCDYPLVNSSTSGTWSIVVTPNGNTTMSFNGIVMNDPNEGAISSGAPVSVSLPQFGQHNLYTFSAQAGQSVVFSESGISTDPSGYNVNGWVIAPNGAVVTEISSSSNGSTTLSNLAQSGTYTIAIEPAYAATASLTIEVTVSGSQ